MVDRRGRGDAGPFLRGERGITYSEELPQGSSLVAGDWWPKGYRGPPLVSLDRQVAKRLDLGVGESITVSVLGREIEARIASLRQVNWETMGFNYIMVFSPNALQSAPHKLAATISMDAHKEAAMSRALLAAFPSATVINVAEVIGEVRGMLDQMAIAISLAGSVTVLAGLAVLVGAIAASRQSRSYDSVILKTLGATRGHILLAQGLEYALLAVVLALLALAIGLFAGWIVIARVFEFNWTPDWPIVLGTLGAGAILTLLIGLIGSIPIISIRPAQALRRLQLS
jgi:putative ABC transport system permease protein